MKTYRFINDPGHGWLEVPTAELITLGIADTISSCSYQSRDRRMAYLEEDCDAPRFDHAMASAGITWEHVYTYLDPCFVRQLPSYQALRPGFVICANCGREFHGTARDCNYCLEPNALPGEQVLGCSERDEAIKADQADQEDQADQARTMQAGDAFNLGNHALLAALKNLVERGLVKYPEGDHYTEVLEAIAKAEGWKV
jgi:hypothetical protein